jgi:hypothetical protein
MVIIQEAVGRARSAPARRARREVGRDEKSEVRDHL